MIPVSAIRQWLKTLGVTTPIADGYYIPPKPDQIVFITIAGGPGTINERVLDRLAFQVHCRGSQHRKLDVPDPAEALAAQVDSLILAVVAPVYIGGVFVNDVDRLGSPPRFSGRDLAFRSSFTASYILTYAL